MPEINYLEYATLSGETGSGQWAVRAEGDGLIVRMPDGVIVDLLKIDWSDPGVWDRETVRALGAGLLWFRSLCYLDLLWKKGARSIASTILDSYLAFLSRRESRPGRFGMDSLDHCVALNLRALCRLTLLAEDPVMESRCRNVASSVLRLLDSGVQFQKGNRGVMLAIAVIHANYLMRLDYRCGPSRSFCIQFLRTTFFDIADSRGLVQDNTAAYQGLWASWCMEAVWTLDRMTDEQVVKEELKVLALRMRRSYRSLIVGEGSLLPIGDGCSASLQTQTPLRGTHISPEIGQMICNDGSGTLLSFTCGFRSAVHKHCDDTAVRLWCRGVELIADAGFYSYEWKNPVAACVASQRGHSGLFFRRFDDVPCQLMYPWDDIHGRVYAMMADCGSTDRLVVEGARAIDEEYRVTRTLKASVDDGLIEIVDRAVSPDEAPVARYLIPESLTPVGGGPRFEGAGCYLDFKVPEGTTWSYTVGSALASAADDGDTFAIMQGVQCRRPHAPVACGVLEIEIPKAPQGHLLRYRIRFGVRPARVFVLGGPVGRNTIEATTTAGEFYLVGSMEGQSILSGEGPASREAECDGRSLSSEEEREKAPDSIESLIRRIKSAGDVDILLWDLMDECAGVCESDDAVAEARRTSMSGATSADRSRTGNGGAEFGSSRYMTIFRDRAERLRDELIGLGMFSRTLVMDVPLPSAIERGDRSVDRADVEILCAKNDTMRPALVDCYSILDDLGYASMGLRDKEARMVGTDCGEARATVSYSQPLYEAAAHRVIQFAGAAGHAQSL